LALSKTEMNIDPLGESSFEGKKQCHVDICTHHIGHLSIVVSLRTAATYVLHDHSCVLRSRSLEDMSKTSDAVFPG